MRRMGRWEQGIGVVGFKMILCKLDVPKKKKESKAFGKNIYININIPSFFGDVLQKRFGRVFNEAENSEPAFWGATFTLVIYEKSHVCTYFGAALCKYVNMLWFCSMDTSSKWQTSLKAMNDKNEDHKLCTHSIYQILLFPIYIEFFWVVKQPSQCSYLASH